MGLKVTGMDAWLRDLETLPERAPEAFRKVTSRAGVQIKLDWKARWNAISHVGHIPHLIRNIGYDLSQKGSTFSVTVGVAPGRLQSRLASFIEFGTLTSAPHPAGQKALDTERPKFERAALDVAVELLEEGRK
jgi:hypothetical protein